MRQVGNRPDQSEATRFAAYLVTEGIAAHTEADGDRWIIWVHDENQVAEAKESFARFTEDPESEVYRGAERKAEEILAAEARAREEASKNVIEMRGRWRRGGAVSNRRRPLVMTLIFLSIGVFLLSSGGNASTGAVARTVKFADLPLLDASMRAGLPYDPLISIRRGELWRVVTPIFFHFDILHIVFNMFMLYQLGSPVEDRRGTVRFGLMVLAMAIISNCLQALVPLELDGGPGMGGMSGVVYGVFGYSWMKSRFEPELGIFIPRSTVVILMAWFFLCMTPMLPNVANWAHGGGLAVGLAIGYWPTFLRSVTGG